MIGLLAIGATTWRIKRRSQIDLTVLPLDAIMSELRVKLGAKR